MLLKIYQVDAFSQKPFEGNPAAVCLLSEVIADDIMQKVAQEMNLSETAFIYPKEKNSYRLRWFTPSAEVKLCGHATLSAAHILFEKSIATSEVLFETLSGQLGVHKQSAGLYSMAFPKLAITPRPELKEQVAHIIQCDISAIYTTEVDIIAVLNTQQSVDNLQFNISDLKQINMQGLIVTAPADDVELDFVSRYFAPNVGVDEDPVTGSTHCGLATYWQQQLSKNMLKARQISYRPGDLGLEVMDDRVNISGNAITVMEGTLYI